MEEKTYSVYIHKVNTENGPLYYTGVTKNIKQRWIPSLYKDTSLWFYIEKYGWENIEHVTIFETDNREMAIKTEDMLICGYAALGRCVNRKRSGHIVTSDKKAYTRKYNRDKYATDHEFAERQRQYERKIRATPEGKIYHRVEAFNRHHPDRITESPLEARDNYIKYHIIPQYIKHDDL